LAKHAALRHAYRRCARVLFIGTRSRSHYAACGVAESRLVFSPYCVDTTPFRADERARLEMRAAVRASYELRDDAFVVMFAGKLTHRKGVDLLPLAVSMLPDGLRQRTVLLFVGDGVLRASTEAAARSMGVAARFAGFRSQHELSACYHAADALVLPSRLGETWGLVVNEALWHGVPCVVSDRVGCAPDLVDADTGVVCAAESAHAVAGALTEVASRLLNEETRARCRARVAGYSVEAAAAGIADAYRASVAQDLAA
jgi:glycosyltransferase involved in cell wall biosynthesis